jgi:hypothetical protein
MAMDVQRVAQRRRISVEQVQLLRSQRGLTEAGIERLPEVALKSALRRLDYPDSPRARLMYRLDQSRDDRDSLPRQPLVAALRQLDGMRLRTRWPVVAGVPTGGVVRPASLAMAPPAVAGLGARQWKSLGPGNIGGRTRSILVHPNTHATMWVASVGGGVWRSDDAGGSWLPVDDFMANLAVTSMVMHPADPNCIFAATGEGFGNVDALRGGGIFRTTDGTHWTQLAATAGAGWDRVNRLAISADGTTLLAATNEGLQRSVDPARAIWQKVLAADVADVKFHPGHPQHAVAGSISTGKAWFTTDGGASWTEATHASIWSRRVELCYARAAVDTVYASVDSDTGGEIWRSTNGGQSFTKRATLNVNGDPASYLGDQGWYGNVIWAGDPTNANLVIVGGVDLWRSTDGGDSLVDISTWWEPTSVHADHHAIVSHPAYDGAGNHMVFFGNDGGVYRAADVTTVGNDAQPPRVAGWTKLNNTYGVTQFFSAAGHPATGVIVAGAQDNGSLAYDPAAGANAWTSFFGGDGGFCCSDPTNPKVFYGEYVYLNIHRNTDGATTADVTGDRYISGQFWNVATGQWDWKPPPFRIPDAFNQQALFIAPFLLDPANPSRILAGGRSLWRTNDATTANTPTSGPQWSSIKPPSNGKISALAIAPGNSDVVWVGHEKGEIWRSLNGTAAVPTWSRINGQGPSPIIANRFCHQIFVSPHDPNTVLVAFGGFTAGNIWRSDDGGATWADISGALPAAPVRAVAIHPGHADWFYIGTEVGVFASEDRGVTWSPTNEGPANVSVEDLFWIGQDLICATHGRGLFSITLGGAPAGGPPGPNV